jgi:hypothetical protein
MISLLSLLLLLLSLFEINRHKIKSYSFPFFLHDLVVSWQSQH